MAQARGEAVRAAHQSGSAASISVRPLTPGDADALARLEAVTYPPGLRAGRRQLRADLADADEEDSNLGFGLFSGDELVGMFLIYYEPDSRRLFDYFGMAVPPDVEAEECLYVADFVVRREYSRYTMRLMKAWTAQQRAYRGLPILGFSTRDAFERWRVRASAFKRYGYLYSGSRRFEVPEPPHEVFVVRFEFREDAPAKTVVRPELHVEAIRSHAAWERLAPHWDALLFKTPDWTAFQSYAMQRTWWSHFGGDSRLYILVAREGERVRAIAPLRVRPTSYWGRTRKLLKFIGEHGELDRPTILHSGDDREAVEAIIEYLVVHDNAWDALLFYEQPPDGLVPSLVRKHFDGKWLAGVVPGPACPWVDVDGSWQTFLAAKPRTFRKGLKRKLERLRKLGEVRFATFDRSPGVEEAFEQYIDVEARSRKHGQGVGVTKTETSLAYHRALVESLGPQGKLPIRVLSVDGRAIAATFGVLERGQFLSLHIAHDREFDAYSPGVLLTAYELEEAYARSDYRQYELLGGFLNNKMTWMPRLRETVQVYIYRREPLFLWHYAFHFVIQPALKRVLKRVGLFDAAQRAKTALRNASTRGEGDDGR